MMKDHKILELEVKIQQFEAKIKELESKNQKLQGDYQDNMKKGKSAKEKIQEELEGKIKQLDSNLTIKQTEIQSLHDNLSQLEKKYLEKECEAFGLNNKNKKN